MTIRVKKQLSPDLIQNANWPMFSARPDLRERYFSVAAYTLTWSGSDDDTPAFSSVVAKDLEHHFVRAVVELGCTFQALVVDSTMQPRAATVLYRKIWKALPMKSVPNSVERGFENLIECVSGVRFASLANIPMVAFPWMISTVGEFDIVVPLLLRSPYNIHDASALELAGIAFPPDGCSAHSRFDWAAFSCHIAMLGGFCVRCTGSLVAGEFAVDFFASEENTTALVQILERDDERDTFRVH
jgi:hypothetical protein